MRRLTDDMTRLVGRIHAARDDRARLRRDLKHATFEMRRVVAHLRSRVAADLAGARAAWVGAMVAVPTRRAETATIAAPGVEREGVLPREPAEERRRLKAKHEGEARAKHEAKARAKRRAGKAKPPAPDKARTVHKAKRRHRSR